MTNIVIIFISDSYYCSDKIIFDNLWNILIIFPYRGFGGKVLEDKK